MMEWNLDPSVLLVVRITEKGGLMPRSTEKRRVKKAQEGVLVGCTDRAW